MFNFYFDLIILIGSCKKKNQKSKPNKYIQKWDLKVIYSYFILFYFYKVKWLIKKKLISFFVLNGLSLFVILKFYKFISKKRDII